MAEVDALYVKQRHTVHAEGLGALHQFFIESDESGAITSASKVQRIGKIHTR